MINKNNPDWNDLSVESMDPRVKPEDDNESAQENNLQIMVNTDLWKNIDYKSIISKALKHIPEAQGEISILLTNNIEIQKLNKQYRGKDKPTNVLSFPQDEGGLLGDVVMAYETLQTEALEQEKSLHDHFTHLFVHSVLHLLGYDHEEDEDQKHMEQKEMEILHKLGISDPYN